MYTRHHCPVTACEKGGGSGNWTLVTPRGRKPIFLHPTHDPDVKPAAAQRACANAMTPASKTFVMDECEGANHCMSHANGNSGKTTIQIKQSPKTPSASASSATFLPRVSNARGKNTPRDVELYVWIRLCTQKVKKHFAHLFGVQVKE